MKLEPENRRAQTGTTLTWVLLLTWVILIAFGAVAALEPPWFRDLSGASREVESRGIKSAGDAYLRQGHYEEAIERYRIALEIRPDYVGALVNLAVAYGRTGREERGERILKDALARGSSRPGVISYNLGDLLERQGKTEEAIRQYKLALDTTVRPDRVWRKLGGVYVATGRYDEARAALESALAVQLDPCTSYRHMLRRSLTTHAGFPASMEAVRERIDAGVSVEDLVPYDLEIITRTQQGSRDVARTHLELGRLHALLGERAQAAGYLRQALRTWPENGEAANLLREQERLLEGRPAARP